MGSPTLCLASLGNGRILEFFDEDHAPAVLISYYYLNDWIQHAPVLEPGKPALRMVKIARRENSLVPVLYRSWCMDSGAFSAWTKGITIDLDAYIRTCQHLLATDPTLTEVFTLDVIGRPWQETMANTERMWAAGVPAIPVYHVGEPESVLVGYARDYPKIALGGMVKLRGQTKVRFAEQCFARIWPCAVHGLGATGTDVVMAVPWHSVDASSFEMGPRGYGQWKAFGGKEGGRGKLSTHGYYDVRPEVAWYLQLEQKMRWRWSKEMKELEDRAVKVGT